MIHTPGIVAVDDHSAVSSTFSVEPLHSGYGMTLGNSLRRVLLSSISGAAVTSFKIEGLTHEFTAIPGVKEDAVDVMLNLKGIRFRVYGDEPQNLRIVKTGKGVVTAKDIELNADVEVVNPEHVIATIDGDKTKFVMDINE
jgi:DNA-directed RNA polymerase subunit alpha